MPCGAAFQQTEKELVGSVAETRDLSIGERPQTGRTTPPGGWLALAHCDTPALKFLEAPSDALAASGHLLLQLGLGHRARSEPAYESIRQVVRKDAEKLSRPALHLFLSKLWTKIAPFDSRRPFECPVACYSESTYAGGKVGSPRT
jgi:hypothetical protein